MSAGCEGTASTKASMGFRAPGPLPSHALCREPVISYRIGLQHNQRPGV